MSHLRSVIKMISLVLLITMLYVPTQASQESVGGFNLHQCHSKGCTILSAGKALRSEMDDIYSFGKASLVTYQSRAKGAKVAFVISAEDGYYDPVHGRIILRGIEGPKEELVMNLKTGIVMYF